MSNHIPPAGSRNNPSFSAPQIFNGGDERVNARRRGRRATGVGGGRETADEDGNIEDDNIDERTVGVTRWL